MSGWSPDCEHVAIGSARASVQMCCKSNVTNIPHFCFFTSSDKKEGKSNAERGCTPSLLVNWFLLFFTVCVRTYPPCPFIRRYVMRIVRTADTHTTAYSGARSVGEFSSILRAAAHTFGPGPPLHVASDQADFL